MRKIKLYIAASLDGYIARQDGNVDWLDAYPITREYDYGYYDFYHSIDTILMGGNSFRSMLTMSKEWAYPDKMTYVITHNPQQDQKSIRFVNRDIEQFVLNLRAGTGDDIWLFGGGKLITRLLNDGLVDEMIITYIPVILGSGISLFPDNPRESVWNLVENTGFNNGVLQVKYSIKKT